MKTKYIIDHEKYGERSVFDSLEEAVAGIKACGPDFADVELRTTQSRNGRHIIVDQDGATVGAVVIPCKVRWTNGRNDQRFQSIYNAMHSVALEYPDMIACDAGGFGRDQFDPDFAFDIRGTKAATIWENDAAAHRWHGGDDGGFAIAEIVVDE